jgi:hypothetical protein
MSKNPRKATRQKPEAGEWEKRLVQFARIPQEIADILGEIVTGSLEIVVRPFLPTKKPVIGVETFEKPPMPRASAQIRFLESGLVLEESAGDPELLKKRLLQAIKLRGK